jgi:hypothetical protein
MKKILYFILVGLMFSQPALAREGDNYFIDWMTYYYQNKDTSKVPDFLKWLQERHLVESKKTAAGPIAAFLSVVFSENPDKVSDWVDSTNFTGNTKQTITLALWLSGDTSKLSKFANPLPPYARKPSPKLSEIPADTTAVLDMMWGAFSASGDPVYVKKVIDSLDASNTIIRGGAEWSLTSNAKMHEKVRTIIKEEINTRSDPIKSKLEQIIAGKTPQP